MPRLAVRVKMLQAPPIEKGRVAVTVAQPSFSAGVAAAALVVAARRQHRIAEKKEAVDNQQAGPAATGCVNMRPL